VRFSRSNFPHQTRSKGRVDRRVWGRTPAAGGILWIAFLAVGFLSGCRIESLTPTAQLSPTPTPTPELPLASLLPTLNIVDTETPAPTDTLTPVITRLAAVGERILYDPLNDNRSGWTLPKTAWGSAAFSNGMLVFTVSTSNAPLSSTLPQKIPSDVYIEVTVQTIICGAGVDTFGLIFRNQGDNNYRYVVTCRGQMRMERYAGEGMNGASAWKDTIGLLKGAPATNHIGVLVQGNVFRFFVNGAEVFSTRDTVSASGGMGLFIRSEKSQMVSVGFDELAIYAVGSSSE
jgi:hypothetical protein